MTFLHKKWLRTKYQLHMAWDILKVDYQKAMKKLTLFFLSNLLPLNEQHYQKQKGPETSDKWLFRLRNKFRKIHFLLMHYLTKFVDVKQFLSYSKNYICKFIQANSWHINYYTSICPYASGKCGKEEKVLQKFEYFKNEKTFFNEIKNIFHCFWRTIIWWKNKTLIKK